MSGHSSAVHRLLRRSSAVAQVRQAHAHLIVSGELLPTSPSAVFLLNTLIRSYSRTGGGAAHFAAVLLHRHLLRCSLAFDSHTLPFLVAAASAGLPSSAAVAHGGAAHALSIRRGFSSHLHLTNALIHFYSLSKNLPAALLLLHLSPSPDTISFNTLISGYFKSGDSSAARHLFDEMPDSQKNPITWTAMISGHAQQGNHSQALSLFSKMQNLGVAPMAATLVAVLSACAHLGALQQGRWVHSYLKATGAAMTVFLGTSLVDMYCRCGDLDAAMAVFESMPEKNLLSWTSIISGFAAHGRGTGALQLFRRLQHSGVAPDDIAFLGALSACSAAGLVSEGLELFSSMKREHSLEPKVEHYGCLIDLLARAGRVREAAEEAERMPMRPDGRIWSSIMAGCALAGEVEVAEMAAERLVKEEPENAAVYVLLGNVYAAAGMHGEAGRARGEMRRRRLGRTPGWSSVEVAGELLQFTSGGEVGQGPPDWDTQPTMEYRGYPKYY